LANALPLQEHRHFAFRSRFPSVAASLFVCFASMREKKIVSESQGRVGVRHAAKRVRTGLFTPVELSVRVFANRLFPLEFAIGPAHVARVTPV
jgi:hypothetical protein